VRIEIGIDAIDPEGLAAFWSVALGYEIGDMDSANTYLDLVPAREHDPVVYFQRVSERKLRKNRVHLDLYVDDPDATIARLVSLGATVASEIQTGAEGGWWRVLADPEGNEFCVCGGLERA